MYFYHTSIPQPIFSSVSSFRHRWSSKLVSSATAGLVKMYSDSITSSTTSMRQHFHMQEPSSLRFQPTLHSSGLSWKLRRQQSLSASTHYAHTHTPEFNLGCRVTLAVGPGRSFSFGRKKKYAVGLINKILFIISLVVCVRDTLVASWLLLTTKEQDRHESSHQHGYDDRCEAMTIRHHTVR
jgi:hypothetical protein